MKVCGNCWKEKICSCSITESCPYWEAIEREISTAEECLTQ